MYNFDIAFLTHHYYILYLSALKKKMKMYFHIMAYMVTP